MPATVITDANIRSLVDAYVTNRFHLPDDMRGVPIGKWDVSRVTDMRNLFYKDKFFNEDISDWDVSNVKDMSLMFHDSQSFNQPIGKWRKKTGKVETMYKMFSKARAFNKPLNDWDVSNVKDMVHMFSRSGRFNQALNRWNVSNVEDMSFMFELSQFNKPIGNWVVSKVTNMAFMFSESYFASDISRWDVSNVENMESMFAGNPIFDQNIGRWNVSNVKNMNQMFCNARAFNQDISRWDVSNVEDMSLMFHAAIHFNQNLDRWNVPQEGVDIQSMFAHDTAMTNLPSWYYFDLSESDEDSEDDESSDEEINMNYTKTPITNKSHIDLKREPTLRDSIIAGEDIDIKSHVLQKTDGEYEYWIFVHELTNSQNKKQYYYSLIHKGLINQFLEHGRNANDGNFRMMMSRLGINIGAKIYYRHFVDVYNNVYNPRQGPNIYFIQKLKNDPDMYFLRYVNQSTFFNKFNVSNVRNSKKIDLHPLKPYNSILKEQFKSLNRSKAKEFLKGTREILGRRIAIKRIGKSIREVKHRRLSQSKAKGSIRVRSYSPHAKTRSHRKPSKSSSKSKSITRRRSY